MKKHEESEHNESTTKTASRTSMMKTEKVTARTMKAKTGTSTLTEGLVEDDEQGIMAEGDCRLHHTLHIRQEALCCQYSQDGRLFALGILNSTIRVYDPPVVNCLYILTDPEIIKTQLPVTCVRFQPSLMPGARRVHFLGASYASGFIKVWKVEEKICTFSIKEDRQTLTIAFSNDGSVISSAGSDAKIYVYDLDSMQRIHILKGRVIIKDGENHLGGIEWLDRGRGHCTFELSAICFYVSSLMTKMSKHEIWDDREQHSVRSIYGPHVCGDGIDFLPEENLILTASWHKRHPLQLWDYLSGELVKDIRPDTVHSLLYCGQFMKKNFILTGGSNANVLRIIDRLSYTTIGMLKNLPNAVFCISNNPYFVYPKVVGISGDYIYVVELKIRRPMTGPE